MRQALFPISLLLSSAACSSQADYARETGIRGDPDAIVTAAAPATPVAFEDSDAREGGAREFAYKWPAAVAAQPALAEQLAAERDRILAQEKTEWAAALAESPPLPDCPGCRQRSYEMTWKVVADTPAFLSLSGDYATYAGGAHGMYGLRSLVWDKRAKRAFDGVALFRSPAALDAALGPKLCAALNAEREKRRGEPVVPGASGDVASGFDSCHKVADATVLVGSSTGKAFDRIGIWFGPYVAGPYAEGAYELNFPVDAAVLEAVKPEHVAAFKVR
jgi:hypothetical protein